MNKVELLAPAGNFDKLKTAIYFGADAVYCAGKLYGMRAAADNFDNDELRQAVEYCHSRGKKIYITLNILAREDDFAALPEFLQFLETIKPDGLIIADLGVLALARQYAPSIDCHISTQASVTNTHTAMVYVQLGATRIIPARELTIAEIKALRAGLPDNVEIECFIHGAMCMAYSGHCIISNFNTGREANSGKCTQPCRYEYTVKEKVKGTQMDVVQDERGTYIFNSKDLNMISHLDDLINAGVTSLKIEGRVKSKYYVGCVVNAYRRALDEYFAGKPTVSSQIIEELDKAGSRNSGTGLYYQEDKLQTISLDTAKPIADYDFTANCITTHNGQYAIIEMRNRFQVGDELEIVSPHSLGSKITVVKMTDTNGVELLDAKNVQQHIHLYTDYPLNEGDLLRKKAGKKQAHEQKSACSSCQCG